MLSSSTQCTYKLLTNFSITSSIELSSNLKKLYLEHQLSIKYLFWDCVAEMSELSKHFPTLFIKVELSYEDEKQLLVFHNGRVGSSKAQYVYPEIDVLQLENIDNELFCLDAIKYKV